MSRSSSLERELRQLLDPTGIPWELRHGGSHRKIVVAGRLVGIIPRTGGDERGNGRKNVIAQVRRAIRGATP